MDIGRVSSAGTSPLAPAAASSAAPSGPSDSVILGGGGDAAVQRASLEGLFRKGEAQAPHVFWTSPTPDERKNPRGGGFLPARPVPAPDGGFYLGTHRGSLLALDRDGKERWRHDLGGSSAYNDPTIGWDGALVLSNCHDPRVVCLESDGRVRFDETLSERATAEPAVDLQGRVFVLGEKALHVLDADGKPLGNAGNPAKFCGFFLRPDGSALVYGVGEHADDLAHMQCVEPDGHVRWRYDFTEKAGGVPATGPGGETVVAEGSYLRVLGADGAVQSTIELGGGRLLEPVVDPGGRVYVASDKGQVSALDLGGKKLWSAHVDGSPHWRLHLGADGRLYVGCSDGKLHALDAETGRTAWVTRVGNDPRCRVVATPDGTVFAETSDLREVHVLDPDGLRRGVLRGELLSMADAADGSGRMAVADFEQTVLLGPAGWTENLPPESATTPRPPGCVERVGDWVIVDGVRVPVRKSGGL